jgi:hypothetical protein
MTNGVDEHRLRAGLPALPTDAVMVSNGVPRTVPQIPQTRSSKSICAVRSLPKCKKARTDQHQCRAIQDGEQVVVRGSVLPLGSVVHHADVIAAMCGRHRG